MSHPRANEPANWPALGVAGRAVVRDSDGRVLLVQRQLQAATDPGAWELPGGKMDYGETLPSAVAREVAEETGLGVRVGAPFHVTHFTKEPFWVTSVAFVCELESGEIALSAEHVDHAWITPTDLAERAITPASAAHVRVYAALARTDRAIHQTRQPRPEKGGSSKG